MSVIDSACTGGVCDSSGACGCREQVSVVVRQNRRVTKSALALMIVASVLTGAASAWSLAEPLVFSALGVAKASQRGG